MSIFHSRGLNKKGFTLVEALLSVAFLSIMGMGVIYFFKNSLVSMHKTQSNIILRDESASVFENILNDLRQSEDSSVVIDRFSENNLPNSLISFVVVPSAEKIFYYQDGASLFINRKNAAKKLLDNLVFIQFSSSSYKTYSVSMKLGNSKENFSFESSVFVRN
ncbi:MAG TPA: hypothetical protein DCX95_06320 [Elusimicrobia bacterium]|nr:hypothetical protein [Elusimicrobiota bacterium]